MYDWSYNEACVTLCESFGGTLDKENVGSAMIAASNLIIAKELNNIAEALRNREAE